MKLVLFFTRNYGLKTWAEAGILEREVALYQRLQAQGVQVTFITYGNADDLAYQETIPGIRILYNRFNLKPKRYERWLPYLHAPALFGADLIKTNQTDGAEIALRAAQIWGKPIIARCGYMWAWTTANLHQSMDAKPVRYAYATETKVFSNANHIVVTTPAMKADIEERIPTHAPIDIMPNYVDTDLFSPQDVAKTTDIIFIGRLAEEKNADKLLEAIEPFDVTLTMIGDGVLADDLKARFGDLNGRVRWLGRIPHAEIPAYLHQARVYILPSQYEGHPKTLIEAMACGLPVIGTDVNGIRDVIQHGENGWLCDTSVEGIRQAITQLLNQPDLQQQLGQRARQYALENYALDTIAQREHALYQQVINRAKTKRG